MKIIDIRDRLGHVMASRADLRRIFPEKIWRRLPEGERVYAFGVWEFAGIGCPVMQAFGTEVEGFPVWTFDMACRRLARGDTDIGPFAIYDRPSPTPVAEPATPIPTP